MSVLKPSMSLLPFLAEAYLPAECCRILYPKKLNPAIPSSLFSAFRV